MNKGYKIFTIGLLLSILGICLYMFFSFPKIGYVKSEVLIYEFEGMKVIQSRLADQKQKWQSNIDTLNYDFQKALNKFESEVVDLSEEEGLRRKQLLISQQENIANYARTIEEKVAKEENELLEGVLNQVNALSKEYGEKKGYDLILGTTQSGNVLHGGVSMDVTDDVLGYLNKRYYEGSN